ncbi:hypothetical protein, partial [Neisseria dentiae]|uniref:hypothetical protein n=1 Tax=Neisseria dentiae TaxID=194197 RepID=UPI00359FF5BA
AIVFLSKAADYVTGGLRCKNIRHHTTQCPADKLFGRGANAASAVCFHIIRFSRLGICTG